MGSVLEFISSDFKICTVKASLIKGSINLNSVSYLFMGIDLNIDCVIKKLQSLVKCHLF